MGYDLSIMVGAGVWRRSDLFERFCLLFSFVDWAFLVGLNGIESVSLIEIHPRWTSHASHALYQALNENNL